MPKQIVKKVSGQTTPIIGVVLGVLMGYLLDRGIDQALPVESRVLWRSNGFVIGVNDLAVIIIGFALLFLGGKMHRIVKYMGLGILGFELAEELYELTTGAPSFDQPIP